MNTFFLAVSRVPIIRLALAALLWALVLSVGASPARADAGPKPSMDFTFESESGAPFTILSGEQFECDAADCSDAQPLEELGPQRFSCTQTSCSSLAYGYSDYHRLRISFADGRLLESNVFGKEYYEASYNVTIRANDLLVQELRGGMRPLGFVDQVLFMGVYSLLCVATLIFLAILGAAAYAARRQTQPLPRKRAFLTAAWALAVVGLLGGSVLTLALPLTALFEGLIAWVYARLRKLPALALVTTLTFANCLTLPLLWYFVRLFGGKTHGVLLGGEVVVWLVETLILYAVLRKNIRWWDAALVSFMANTVSFLAGLLLPI